jgi:hypothetical protein
MGQSSSNTSEKPLIAPRTAWIALAALMVLATALILYMGRGLNFYADEWIFIQYRDGHDVVNFISSYAGHLLLWPTAVYAFLFHAVGLDHYIIYRLVGIPLFLACSLLVYLLARRRIGDVAALAPAGLLLFLGSGWMDILWPLQIVYTGALAFGLGAILALDREDLVGDALACLSLTICLGWSGLAVPFVPAVATGLLVRRRFWRSVWVFAVPAALYMLWAQTYGEQHIIYALLDEFPHFLLKISGAGVAGVGGLPNAAGRFLLVPLAALVAIRLRALRWESTLAWEALVLVIAFWGLTALARLGVHEAASPRYVYPGAVFLLLLAVGLAPRGVPGRRATAAVLALGALCLPLNLVKLSEGRDKLKSVTNVVSAELGAMQLARDQVAPEYSPYLDGFPDVVVAGPLFAAFDRYASSPVDTPAEIAAAPEQARRRADATSIAALRVRLGEVGGTQRRGGSCVAASGSGIELAAPAASAEVSIESSSAPATVGLRRFASRYRQLPQAVPAGSRRLLRIPEDAERSRPWQVQVNAPTGPVRVCGVQGAAARRPPSQPGPT